MENLFKSFADELEERRLAKGDDKPKMTSKERSDTLDEHMENHMATFGDQGGAGDDPANPARHKEWMTEYDSHRKKLSALSDSDLKNHSPRNNNMLKSFADELEERKLAKGDDKPDSDHDNKIWDIAEHRADKQMKSGSFLNGSVDHDVAKQLHYDKLVNNSKQKIESLHSKLSKSKMDPEERNSKISDLASDATESDTGVSPHDQKALSDYGENSWYAEHGTHSKRLGAMSDGDIHKLHTKTFGKVKKSESDSQTLVKSWDSYYQKQGGKEVLDAYKKIGKDYNKEVERNGGDEGKTFHAVTKELDAHHEANGKPWKTHGPYSGVKKK